MKDNAPSYHGYRFPPEIISHAIWLYHRFCLSFRDVEDLLAERGILVSYETIRQWCRKFGPEYARRLKRRQGRLGDTWHLDELFVNIRGQQHYLWRAVDQDGDVIDILLQPRRDRRAAERFFRKLLKGQGREPRRTGHRQAEELCGSAPNHHALSRPRHKPIREQSGGSLPRADPTAGATNAKVQIHGSSATVLVGAWDHPESLPCRTPSAASSQLPNTAGSCLRCMERGDVCLTRPEVNRRWAGRAPASLS